MADAAASLPPVPSVPVAETPPAGLSGAQVAERVSRGLTNASQLQTGIATTLVGAPGAATIGALVVAAVVGAVATRAERLRHFTAPSPRPIVQAAEAGGES